LRASCASNNPKSSFRNVEGQLVFVSRLPENDEEHQGAVVSGEGFAGTTAASVSSRPGNDDDETERALMVRSLQVRKDEQTLIIRNMRETIRDSWKKLNAAEAMLLALSMEEAALLNEDFVLPVEEAINDADTVAVSEPPAPVTSDPFMVDAVGEPAAPGWV
jgi:hypothetical protein